MGLPGGHLLVVIVPLVRPEAAGRTDRARGRITWLQLRHLVQVNRGSWPRQLARGRVTWLLVAPRRGCVATLRRPARGPGLCLGLPLSVPIPRIEVVLLEALEIGEGLRDRPGGATAPLQKNTSRLQSHPAAAVSSRRTEPRSVCFQARRQKTTVARYTDSQIPEGCNINPKSIFDPEGELSS